MKKNQNSQQPIILLRTWVQNADDALYASTVIDYHFLLERRHGGGIAMFLLHYSIELYLKAFLMSKKVPSKRTHDLEYLFEQCRKIDPEINCCSTEKGAMKKEIKYWIKWINPFNKDSGGIRYLNSERTKWAYPLGIQGFFKPMIDYIKSQVDMNTDITSYCSTP